MEDDKNKTNKGDDSQIHHDLYDARETTHNQILRKSSINNESQDAIQN